MRTAIALVIFGAVFVACEIRWPAIHRQCYGAFSPRRFTIEGPAGEYGLVANDRMFCCLTSSRLPGVRYSTIVAGPLGSLPAVHLLAPLAACGAAMLALGVTGKVRASDQDDAS